MDISIRKRKIISKFVFFEVKFNFEEFFHGIARKNISHDHFCHPKRVLCCMSWNIVSLQARLTPWKEKPSWINKNIGSAVRLY